MQRILSFTNLIYRVTDLALLSCVPGHEMGCDEITFFAQIKPTKEIHTGLPCHMTSLSNYHVIHLYEVCIHSTLTGFHGIMLRVLKRMIRGG